MSSFQKQEVRQAVVYLDAFSSNILLINNNLALFPLINVPLIDFTIENLISSGIEEIYLISSKYDSNLKNYIESNKWGCKLKKTLICLYIADNCHTLGDALREIYSKTVIKSDFILINGLVLSNINLKPILDAHKQRCYKDKINSVMTIILRKTDYACSFKTDNFILVIEPITKKIQYYKFFKKRSNKIGIPLEVICKSKKVQIISEFYDPQICICTPQVPQFYADNFDYQNITHFINDILINEEILGSLIHTHFITDGYVLNVTNLAEYYQANLDIINRWVYPIVPEKWRYSPFNGHNESDKALYKYVNTFQSIYLPRDSSLSKISNHSNFKHCLISNNCHILKKSSICRTIFGQKCQIGHNSVVKDCIFFNDIICGDNCQIDTSILSHGVRISNHVTVNKHCIIGDKVCLPSGYVLPAFTTCFSHQSYYEKFMASYPSSKLVRFNGDSSPHPCPENGKSGKEQHTGPIKYLQIYGSYNGTHSDYPSDGKFKDDDLSNKTPQVMVYMFRAIPEKLIKTFIPFEVISENRLLNTESPALSGTIIPTYIIRKSGYVPFGPRNLFHNYLHHLTTNSKSNNAVRRKSFYSYEKRSNESVVSSNESDMGSNDVNESITHSEDTSSATTTDEESFEGEDEAEDEVDEIPKMLGDTNLGTSKSLTQSKSNINDTPTNQRIRTISTDENFIMSHDDTRGFFFEVQESFQRSQEDQNFPIKNLVLEINASKHAYNVTLQDVWFCIAKILFSPEFLFKSHSNPDAANTHPENDMKRVCLTYDEVLRNYFKSVEAQGIIIDRLLLKSKFLSTDSGSPIVKFLHYLYENDLVDEEAIVSWFKEFTNNSQLLNTAPKTHQQMDTFVKWLEEAEEEGSQDD